jgi:hypothetical protein
MNPTLIPNHHRKGDTMGADVSAGIDNGITWRNELPQYLKFALRPFSVLD